MANSLKKDLVIASINGGSIKALEISMQDVIEKHYPNRCWWEMTRVNIFLELLSDSSFNGIRSLIDKICNGINEKEITL